MQVVDKGTVFLCRPRPPVRFLLRFHKSDFQRGMAEKIYFCRNTDQCCIELRGGEVRGGGGEEEGEMKVVLKE